MSDEWDKVFASRRWGRWPSTRFVEWFMRKFGNVPDRGKVDVLEIGCGVGAQIRFLHEEGFHAIGIDQSERAALKVTEFGAAALIGDIRNLSEFLAEYDLGPFDCIVDVCTLQHMGSEAAQVIAQARHALKPGGYIFSMFAAPSDEGAFTFGDVPSPRILEPEEVHDVFKGFDVSYGMESVIQIAPAGFTRLMPERKHWIIEGRKRDG